MIACAGHPSCKCSVVKASTARARAGDEFAPTEVSARITIFSAGVICRSEMDSLMGCPPRFATADFNSCRSTAESMPNLWAISEASSSRVIRLGTR